LNAIPRRLGPVLFLVTMPLVDFKPTRLPPAKHPARCPPKTANEQDFFRTEKALSLLAEAGRAIPEERTLRFEDLAGLLRLLTAILPEVVRSVKGAPGSVTVFVGRWQRNGSAFKGDRSWIRL